MKQQPHKKPWDTSNRSDPTGVVGTKILPAAAVQPGAATSRDDLFRRLGTKLGEKRTVVSSRVQLSWPMLVGGRVLYGTCEEYLM